MTDFFFIGRDQLIVRFASTTRPNLELKTPAFLGR